MSTELSIEKFSPTAAELQELAKNSEDALSLDLNNETQMDLFKSRKKDLQQARLTITRTGKELREEANAFAKSVIAKEKEYLALITPLESKIIEKYDAHKQAQIREERMAELPERHNILNEIGDNVNVDDDTLLDMDHDQFIAYVNERKSAYFDRLQAEQKEREEKERREREIKEAEQRAAQEAEERARREAEEKLAAEQAAREKAERELQEEKDRQERERVAAEERAKREAEERLEAGRKAVEEEEARKKRELADESYQKWIMQYDEKIKSNPSLYMLKVDEDQRRHRLYKLVDTFTFED